MSGAAEALLRSSAGGSASRHGVGCAVIAGLLATLAPVAVTAQETRTPPPFAGGDAIPHTGAVDVRADRRAAVAKRRAAAGNLVGHGGPVKAVAADATLAFVASGSFDYSLMVWDVRGERPRLVRRHTVFAGAVNAVRFVPGSDRLVAGGDDGQLWLLGRDAAAPVARLEGHKAKINALAVTSDGRFAASAGWDHTARIWDLGGLRAGPVLEGHRGPVNAVEFSGDGATVYTGGTDGRVLAWRRSDGTQLRTVHKHGWGINVLRRVAAAGCDCLIAGTSNGAVLVLDPQAGTIVAELAAHARPVLAVAVLARPGLVATGGGGGVLNVTRIGDWKPIATYQNTFGPVWALAFVEDGKALYYGGLDDFVARWQLSPRAPFEHADSPFPRRFQMGEGLSSGERQFARKCSVCHTLGPDDGNRAGPTLYRIFGRKAGTLPGYPFSEALKRAGFAWDEGTIGQLFAQGPDVFTPGSKMPLQRITDAVMRDALIRFLKSATAEGRGGAAAPEGAQPDPQAKGEKSR